MYLTQQREMMDEEFRSDLKLCHWSHVVTIGQEIKTIELVGELLHRWRARLEEAILLWWTRL